MNETGMSQAEIADKVGDLVTEMLDEGAALLDVCAVLQLMSAQLIADTFGDELAHRFASESLNRIRSQGGLDGGLAGCTPEGSA